MLRVALRKGLFAYRKYDDFQNAAVLWLYQHFVFRHFVALNPLGVKVASFIVDKLCRRVYGRGDERVKQGEKKAEMDKKIGKLAKMSCLLYKLINFKLTIAVDVNKCL